MDSHHHLQFNVSNTPNGAFQPKPHHAEEKWHKIDSPAGVRWWEAQSEPCHMDQLLSPIPATTKGNAITHEQVFGWQTAKSEIFI